MTVEITGIDGVRAQLVRARDAAADLRPVLEQEAQTMAAMIAESWSSGMSPGGETWPIVDGDGGSMRTAHRVTAGEASMQVSVEHPAASFVVYGTRELAGRNPLPIVRTGEGVALDMRGRAGSFWRRHADRIAEHLAGVEGEDIR